MVWAHLTVVALLLCIVPFTLFAYAEQHVPSALASIFNATTPLMTMSVALVALPQERLSTDRVVGLLTGFVGVLIVLAPWRGLGGRRSARPRGMPARHGQLRRGLRVLRRFVSPRGLAATTPVGLGAALLLLAAPVVADDPVRLTAPVVASVAALGVFGTGLAYVWNRAGRAGAAGSPLRR